MQLPVLSLLFLSFALPLNAESLQENITRQYYQSAKKQDFVIAQKVLESCHNDKRCKRIEVIKEALQKAMADKDVACTSWLSAELVFENQDFIHRYPNLCAVSALAIGLLAGGTLIYYGHAESDPFDVN